MKKLKLYLAHDLNTRHTIKEWEDYMELYYSIELINPFYGVLGGRDDIQKLDAGIKTERNYNDCKKLVQRDLDAIDSCDGILAIISEDVQHIGTILEIGYARATKKPIYIISKRYINHPWIRVYAKYKFSTKEEFEEWVKSI